MAKEQAIIVDVKVNIPEETICKCLRVLEMWMDDNPDKDIVVDKVFTNLGFRHHAYIENKAVDDK